MLTHTSLSRTTVVRTIALLITGDTEM
jgi:hypothetical protein